MVFNVMDWESDEIGNPLYRKIHPTQKPVKLIERLISIFTDPGDVVIDQVAGSGSTIIAAENMGRKAYGFEIKKDFYKSASAWIKECQASRNEIKELGFSPTMMKKQYPDQGVLFQEAV
jgi:DNA modification methylase